MCCQTPFRRRARSPSYPPLSQTVMTGFQSHLVTVDVPDSWNSPAGDARIKLKRMADEADEHDDYDETFEDDSDNDFREDGDAASPARVRAPRGLMPFFSFSSSELCFYVPAACRANPALLRDMSLKLEHAGKMVAMPVQATRGKRKMQALKTRLRLEASSPVILPALLFLVAPRVGNAFAEFCICIL